MNVLERIPIAFSGDWPGWPGLKIALSKSTSDLKEFIFFSRDLGYDTLPKSTGAFDRAEQVWSGDKIEIENT